MIMKERRTIERFSLELPTKIKILSPKEEKEEVFDLTTSNISSKGAYFHMVEPIRESTQVKVTISLDIALLRKLTGYQGILTTNGKVIRSNTKGMAIAFEEDFQTDRINRLRIS